MLLCVIVYRYMLFSHADERARRKLCWKTLLSPLDQASNPQFFKRASLLEGTPRTRPQTRNYSNEFSHWKTLSRTMPQTHRFLKQLSYWNALTRPQPPPCALRLSSPRLPLPLPTSCKKPSGADRRRILNPSGWGMPPPARPQPSDFKKPQGLTPKTNFLSREIGRTLGVGC